MQVMSKISGEGLPVKVYIERIGDCTLYSSVLKRLLRNMVFSHHNPTDHFAKFSLRDAPTMRGNVYTVENERFKLSIERRLLDMLMRILINPMLDMDVPQNRPRMGVDGIARMLSPNIIKDSITPPMSVGNIETDNPREMGEFVIALNQLTERMIRDLRGDGGGSGRNAGNNAAGKCSWGF